VVGPRHAGETATRENEVFFSTSPAYVIRTYISTISYEEKEERSNPGAKRGGAE